MTPCPPCAAVYGPLARSRAVSWRREGRVKATALPPTGEAWHIAPKNTSISMRARGEAEWQYCQVAATQPPGWIVAAVCRPRRALALSARRARQQVQLPVIRHARPSAATPLASSPTTFWPAGNKKCRNGYLSGAKNSCVSVTTTREARFQTRQ
jgi:hypothetical protein